MYENWLATNSSNIRDTTKLIAYCMQSYFVHIYLTQIGMRQGTFHPLSFLEQIFGSWIFIKSFKTFFEVKIDINRVNLPPCQAQWVL